MSPDEPTSHHDGGRWLAVLEAADLPEGRRRLLRVQGLDIALLHVGGRLHALADSCPHQGASLCQGRIHTGHIACPAHGLRFDLVSGAMPGGKGLTIAVYPTRVVQGRIELWLSDAAASSQGACR